MATKLGRLMSYGYEIRTFVSYGYEIRTFDVLLL